MLTCFLSPTKTQRHSFLGGVGMGDGADRGSLALRKVLSAFHLPFALYLSPLKSFWGPTSSLVCLSLGLFNSESDPLKYLGVGK